MTPNKPLCCSAAARDTSRDWPYPCNSRDARTIGAPVSGGHPTHDRVRGRRRGMLPWPLPPACRVATQRRFPKAEGRRACTVGGKAGHRLRHQPTRERRHQRTDRSSDGRCNRSVTISCLCAGSGNLGQHPFGRQQGFPVGVGARPSPTRYLLACRSSFYVQHLQTHLVANPGRLLLAEWMRLDSTSTWTVTGTSYVTTLTGAVESRWRTYLPRSWRRGWDSNPRAP